MADLAQLTIEIKANSVAAARAELDKLSAQGAKTEREVGASSAKTSSSFRGIGVAAAAAAVAVGAAFATRAIVSAINEAEQASAQLDAALKSTGGTAGLTAQQIKAYAAELQRTTTVSDDAVISMNAQLMAFDQIQGETFKRATSAIVDLSARMGIDLKSAAIQVGKALQDPADGLSMLARSGVKFSEDQELVIKHLAETNRLAEAQAIILGALEAKFGGAGEAARGTFAGAMTGLSNAMSDVLEGEGSLPMLTQQINALTDALNAPETKSGAASFISFLDNLAASAVRGTRGMGMLIGKMGEAVALGAEIMFGNRDQDPRNFAGGFGSGPMDFETMFGRTGVPMGQPSVTFEQGTVTPTIDPIAAEAERLRAIETMRTITRGGDIDQAQGDEAEAIKAYQSELQTARAALEQTFTAQEKLNASTQQYASWLEQGMITGDEYDKLVEHAVAAADEMSVVWEQAARNWHDALADFFFDPLSQGLDGLLQKAIDIVRRLIAEFAAAKFQEALFGGSGMGGSGGILNAGLGMLFGGFRAGGGDVEAGKSYIVGERRAELFTPRVSGTISPSVSGGRGGVVFSPTYQIDARGAQAGVSAEIQAMLEMMDARNMERLAHYDRYGRVEA